MANSQQRHHKCQGRRHPRQRAQDPPRTCGGPGSKATRSACMTKHGMKGDRTNGPDWAKTLSPDRRKRLLVSMLTASRAAPAHRCKGPRETRIWGGLGAFAHPTRTGEGNAEPMGACESGPRRRPRPQREQAGTAVDRIPDWPTRPPDTDHGGRPPDGQVTQDPPSGDHPGRPPGSSSDGLPG